jgi:hypothetical protein
MPFWIVDAHGYGNRFIVRGDELLTAFMELELTLVRNALNQAYQARPYMKIRRRPTRRLRIFATK